METARRDLDLEAGDTLGHGLAVVTDIERFERQRLEASLIRKGILFDSLLWLRHEIHTWNDVGYLTYLPPIESWLERLFAEIYDGERRLPTGGEVEDLWRRRAGPVPPSSDGAESGRALARRMRWMECWSGDCIAARAGLMRSEDRGLLRGLAPAVQQAQRRVLDRIVNAGIALELNPSSNLRVASGGRLDEVPFIRLLTEHGELALATLNSDDPGTFGTRIENEYALVLQALRESKMPRSKALAVLERLRDVGMRQMRWSATRRTQAREPFA